VSDIEEPLAGGNVNGPVVRIGATVRRAAGPWTPAVHALLAHLQAVGFRGAPRPLGLDERGREVLEFVAGEPAWPEAPFHRLDPDDQLARVGRLIRELHDAVAGFTPPPDARWQELWPPHGDEIIAHHDLAPWNLVLGEDRWAFIDWDGAAPGTRRWDLAYALHGFVPLSAGDGWPPATFGHRMRVLVDAYGLDDEADRRALVAELARPPRAMYDLLADGHATGREPWATLWTEGHGAVWHADADLIGASTATWLAALLD
jgi:hypothetical protein